jgi:anti-anti-sigma factor
MICSDSFSGEHRLVLSASEGQRMEIQKEQVGDAYVVTVSGRLDGIYSTAFANQIGELITPATPKILIDFTDIDFVTSAGLRALLVLMKKAAASSSVFALCGVKEQVREVLDISGFTRMFSIHSGRAEGLAALNVGDGAADDGAGPDRA